MTGGESYWMATTSGVDADRLDGDAAVTVAIVGAGISGLTAAVLLAREGVDVAVLEASSVGSGVTGHTTGKVTVGQGLAYSRIEQMHGGEAARAYASSQAAALELIVALAGELSIECDLERVPNLVFAEREDEIGHLEVEAGAARRAGIETELERSPDAPVPTVAMLRVDRQAQLHARKYVLGLARSLTAAGLSVYERSRVVGLEQDASGRQRVRTTHGSIVAEHVVLATNAPITSRGSFFARVHPWRAYAVAASVAGTPFEGMWINVGSPTRSFRTTALETGERLLLVVGEGHHVGRTDDHAARYEALQAWIDGCFGVTSPTYAWSTQDQYSVDGLPYIGRVGSGGRLYVATGFGGWGLTNGTLSGMLVRDAVLGRRNPWKSLVDPTRSSLRRSPSAFLRENAAVAYRLLNGRLRRRHEALDELGPGEGGVVDLDGRKVAAFRDEEGALQAVSPVCTHMGCLVEWNDAERSWAALVTAHASTPTDRSSTALPRSLSAECRPTPAWRAPRRDEGADARRPASRVASRVRSNVTGRRAPAVRTS
jgi:glycine/D-amino acid oxidase-like deaminating enzyme